MEKKKSNQVLQPQNNSILSGLIGSKKSIEDKSNLKKNYKAYSISPQVPKLGNLSPRFDQGKQAMHQSSIFSIQHNNNLSLIDKPLQLLQPPPSDVISWLTPSRPKRETACSCNSGQVGSNNNSPNSSFIQKDVKDLQQKEKAQCSSQSQQKLNKQKIKMQNKLTQLKEYKPQNLEIEKKIFFEKQFLYNPLFLYSTTDLILHGLQPHTKYMNLAIRILDEVVKNFGCEDMWKEIDGGSRLTQEETAQYFKKYIEDLGIQDYITFEFSENTVAPTSCIHNNAEGISRVVIGLPIKYYKNRIIGVMDHEIGTHFIRKFNDKCQKWNKHRKKWDLQPYSKIEEGLASVNQMYDCTLNQERKPYLFKAALHYYSSVMASRSGFAELFQLLEKYVKDPLERWQECVRVKRGIADTSQPVGMYKDQIYLLGAIKVLRFRKQLNFINLHAGKLTVKDCIRLTEKNQINTDKIKLPAFLKDLNAYYKALDRIAICNFIE